MCTDLRFTQALVLSIMELLGIKSRHGVRVAGEAPETVSEATATLQS